MHRASGQAVVRVNGVDHYLGKYGSETSLAEYRRVLAEAGIVGDRVPLIVPSRKADLSVNELLLGFWEWAKTHYRKNDKPTSEVDNIRQAIRPLRELYGHTLAADFGPLALKAVRDKMVDAGRSRRLVNKDVSRIRSVFRWGVEEELVPVAVHQALQTVKGLQRGRCKAREPEPVKPVDLGTIERTIAEASPVVAAMIRFQQFTGCRPAEVCIVRPADVVKGADVWVYRPREHKTEHHGGDRRIYIGPRAQSVLRPYLNRDPERFCFSPSEARDDFDAERRRNRKSPMTPSQAARRRKRIPLRRPLDRYSPASYRRAVHRACGRIALLALTEKGIRRAEAKTILQRDGVPGSWSPNQLRHTAATLVRERFGIEAAQTVLGHSDPQVTLIYAEQAYSRAAEVMREIG